ncbi:MAG: fasciclin domain-containing protein [Dysgonamonadaceae bacterium]|jgi:uncharacterized surface protein with fasciclin (FAS1) repeats|nr:fasciclin domain-containing protein [Dysgonamonadaceae bacterium]
MNYKRFVITGLTRNILAILFIVGALFLTACNPWADDTKLKNSHSDQTLFELLQANPDVSTFVSILQTTGYDRFLQTESSLTVFAPVNKALQNIDLNNGELLTVWVKNYIALLSHYTNESKQFEIEEIQMLNGKTVPIAGAVISGANIIQSNLLGINGVIHIIDNTIIDRKNIWEYLNEQSGYDQIAFIQSLEEPVMDMDRSVQTGVDVNGRPLYDTIWTNRNVFLENYPLDNERLSFTFILLENNSLNVLKNKYGKYFIQQDETIQNRKIAYELTSDLVLKHQIIEQAGRFNSQNDILVDIDPADIQETYQASNGIVYKLSRSDVKIYENKIKTQIIEAEDYIDRWDNGGGWERRYRNWASNGQDILLKGFTRNTISYVYYLDGEARDTTKTFTFDTKYRDNDAVVNKSSNAYLKYNPTLYSTDYEIYWVAYDDMEKHYTNFSDTLQQPMILEQKLFISFPDEPELLRNSDAKISNHFSANTVFAGQSIAGVHEETQVIRYTVTTANEGIFILDQKFTATDKFGDQTTLKCPTYGTATFFVANTPRELNTNSGILFLDYIKLVPLVDPND